MKAINQIKMQRLFRRIARPDCETCDGTGFVSELDGIKYPCPDCRAAEIERIKEQFENQTYERIGRSANKLARRRARIARIRAIFGLKKRKG